MQGDVDGFIAQYDPKTRNVPKIAAEIALRLLAAGRAGEVDKACWIARVAGRPPFRAGGA